MGREVAGVKESPASCAGTFLSVLFGELSRTYNTDGRSPVLHPSGPPWSLWWLRSCKAPSFLHLSTPRGNRLVPSWMLPTRLRFRLSTHLRGHEPVDFEFRVFPCAIVKMSYFRRLTVVDLLERPRASELQCNPRGAGRQRRPQQYARTNSLALERLSGTFGNE